MGTQQEQDTHRALGTGAQGDIERPELNADQLAAEATPARHEPTPTEDQ